MKVVGLTGGIASGKSTVAKYLRKQGVTVFDADAVAREALSQGTDAWQQVVELFGSDILEDNGSIDRKKLAAIVFEDKSKLRQLEQVLHGYVWQQVENFVENSQIQGQSWVVLDVPLLIECNWHTRVDEVWVVSLEPEEQVRRALARDDIQEQDVRARIKAQLPLQEKEKYADIILNNRGTQEALLAQVERQLERIGISEIPKKKKERN